MNSEEIIEIARQAGFDCYGKHITWDDVICTDELKAFAKLVAAKRTWIGLTDDEFNELYDRYVPSTCYALLIEKVEAKLKEKNI